MFKKLHLFLASLLLLGATTASANGTLVDGIYYLFDGTNATVTYPGNAQPTSGNNAYTGTVEIPATVTHGGTTYNVTAIGDYAFQYSTITSLTMHEGLITVGKWSISSISTITEISFPNSLTTLGSGVSDPLSGNSNLKTITFGTGLTSIGQGFLYSSSGNVTDIYFYGDAAPNVGAYFCNGVSKSTINIHVKETCVSSYKAKFNSYGVAARVVGDLPDSTPFIPLNYSYDSTNKTATVIAPTSGVYNRAIVVPSTVEYNSETYTVTTIGSGAFTNSKITSLTLPETLTRIEGSNFNNVALDELRIPNSVTYISGAGDNGKGSLIPTIYIGSGIQQIDGSFMYDAAVSDVYIYAVNPPSTGTYSFSRNPRIHVYETVLSAYKAVAEWAKVWGNDRNLLGDIVKDYYTYEELQGKLTELQAIPVSTGDPNYCTTASYSTLQTKITDALAITSSSSTAETTAAMRGLLEAESSLEFVPLTAGFYYIVSAGNGPGYPDNGTIYNYENTNAMYNNGGLVKWKTYDRNDVGQLYYIAPETANAWYVYNIADASYIDNGGTGNSGSVYTSKYAVNAQKFHAMLAGHGKFAIESPSYCYGLAQNHNGSPEASGNLCIWGTVNNCITCGVNVWYLHKADDAFVNSYLETKLASFVASKDGLVKSADPNRISDADVVNAFNSAIASAQTAASSGSTIDKVNAYVGLITAEISASETKNEMTEGYYFVVSAGNGPGYSGGPYNYEEKNALYNAGEYVRWKAYDNTDATQLFYITKNGNNWDMYNVLAGTYIDHGGTGNSTRVYANATPSYTQELHAIMVGSGKYAIKSSRSYCFGLSDGHNGSNAAAGNLGIWGNVEEANTYKVNLWYFHAVSAEDANALITSALNNLVEKQIKYSNDPNRVSLSASEASDYRVKVTNAQTALASGSLNDKATAYIALNSAELPSAPANGITEGYYYITSAGEGKGYPNQENNYNYYNYKDANALYNKDGYVQWKTFNDKDLSQIYYISANGSKWNIYNVADGTYINKTTGSGSQVSTSTTTETAQQFTPVNEGSGKYTILSTNYCYSLAKGSSSSATDILPIYPGHNGSYANEGFLYNWGTSAEASQFGINVWYLHKADVTEITIGATGYSTYVTDKALVIPDGVTAYGVTGLSSNDLTMTTLTGNVLAANEPVILQGEANKKYYFIETTEAGSGITGNQLQGTGVGAGLDVAANTAYVLYNNGGTAVFRIAAAMTLPAHKAYLPASFVGGSSSGMFNLSDDLTGVAPIVNGQSSMVNEIFDLQGRKVASPKKGQIYIVNGKTVLY